MEEFYSSYSSLGGKNLCLFSRFHHASHLLANLIQVLLGEIAIPVVIILLLGVLRSVIKPSVQDMTIPGEIDVLPSWDALYTDFPSCYSENLVWRCWSENPCEGVGSADSCQLKRIAIAPSSASNTVAVTTASDFVDFAYNISATFREYSTFTVFESESAFQHYIEQAGYAKVATVPIFAALVVFNGGYPAWDYTIRLNQTYNGGYTSPKTSVPIVDISVKYGEQEPDFEEPYMTRYSNLGYNQISDVLNSFIATHTCQIDGDCAPGDVVNVQTTGTALFPSKAVKINGFWTAVGFLFALLMIMTLLYPLSNMIRALVQEKESKLREGMAMMAMRSDALWTSWIFHFICLFLPLSILLTIASGGLFVYSAPAYIFFYFFVFFLASASYCIFISTLFSRSLTASIVGCLVFFLGFFVYVGIAASNSFQRGAILAACLHPAAAFTFGTLGIRLND